MGRMYEEKNPGYCREVADVPVNIEITINV